MKAIRFAIAAVPSHHTLFPGMGVNMENGTAFQVSFNKYKILAKDHKTLSQIKKLVYKDVDEFFDCLEEMADNVNNITYLGPQL